MKIVITSDHGGFELKEGLIAYLKQSHEVEDLGTNDLASVDYPDYAKAISQKILTGAYDFGIALCGTGIGISIACNRYKGIRCALAYSMKTAKLAKEHNNANIISFGGRTTTLIQAQKRLEVFMKAKFLNGRHLQRINKIEGDC
ncbi:MAG: ribose 5-phosphate isomerase B [Acholeplasmatales bacterium]|jgi:ribose 5-phosphate isomerase B|nr:ribose 5-phosphate isomerase B [Acholeplasmatales bacterium]